LLLDTHIALWAVSSDVRLTKRASSLVLDPRNTVYVSAASIWEISIKHYQARGRRRQMIVPGRKALELFLGAGFEIMPVTADHAAAVDDLPTLHGDPFDRLIVAQALSEPLRLVTHDEALKAYSDTIMLV
jgi:PIN domain nuclease of toxin-antitoxin system